MKKKSSTRSAFFNLRVLLGFTLVLAGVALGVFAGRDAALRHPNKPPRPSLGGDSQGEAAGLAHLREYWHHRLTYPTGRFDPAWVRAAAVQHAQMSTGVPAGVPAMLNPQSPLVLSTTSFTALGPRPERMTGCLAPCFNYTTTAGRVNAIAIDPNTRMNRSIVAYLGSVGGGVWKTTNCCSADTTWSVVTDDPLISTTVIDTVVIDPSNHDTIYAGTGDLNFGGFSYGSQGILKSTDAGAHWTVLGADVFGMAYSEESAEYNAVGKVRVDPNNSNKVVAGTKHGLYFSYDGGATWTDPCPTNDFSTQRQDVTGLELSRMPDGTTRIIAAIGNAGELPLDPLDPQPQQPTTTPTPTPPGANGANGIYKATMGSSGCPSFTSIASNTNGFVFGSQKMGSPYATGANMNAGSGNPYVSISRGNQLGRIDIAVAPSNVNYIYAQVQSIAKNDNGGGENERAGCKNKTGCQLGAWATTNGGDSWSYMEGSQGGALRDCANNAGDYGQNSYDQGVAVDPNDPERVFFDTFDVWFATLRGNSFFDVTCAMSYDQINPPFRAGPVHGDQHALAFVKDSSSILLLGNDGGVHGTINANIVNRNTVPTWFNMDTGLNTIEFYSGDISGNFANAAARSTPQASGGAQDNGASSVTFTGRPAGPVLWQEGASADGFYSRIDPVGTRESLRFWQGNNDGDLYRCVRDCTVQNARWSDNVAGGPAICTPTPTPTATPGSWSDDTKSFILPFDLFHGGIPGGDDCPQAGDPGGCGHLIAGTTRVWETIRGGNATFSSSDWYVTNNPICQNMTKGDTYINQVKYSPKYQNVAMVGTDDGNVWIGFNLGTGTQARANWVNVTGSNTVLPNRSILGVALDPSVSVRNLPVGYAAVGGFNANTATTPGHVFRVSCEANCGSFTWENKTGSLPDIPVDSIIVNPNMPQQVFAGTDWGLYYTNDIRVESPIWQRFETGIPHAMVWDMQIDRGATTLSVWTRSRGAYAYPLPGAGGPTPTPTPTGSPTPTPTPPRPTPTVEPRPTPPPRP
jgi:hypothetical protein